jgi:hypothetical protein
MKKFAGKLVGTIAFLAVFLVFLSLIATPPAAEKIRRVEIAGGEELRGIVIPASDCTFLVQTEEECVEVPAGRIESIDGSRDLSTLLREKRPPLLRYETFEEIEPTGNLVLSSTFTMVNRKSETIREIDWGVAPHEYELLPNWHVFDALGNELAVRVVDEADRKRMFARLVRPVLPGEAMQFANRIVFPGAVKEEGGLFRYAHRGDYPESRLVTKMVRFPAGASIISVSPEPVSRFELDGAPILVFRRFFAKKEVRPIEVTYRLAG